MKKFLTKIGISLLLAAFILPLVSFADRTFTLPDQTGHSGEFLATDGINPSWSPGSGVGVFLPLAGGTMTGALTLNPLVQINPNDAATIGQLTAFVAGAAWKSPGADLATTGNIVLAGEQVIDGTLTAASRVLVKDQALPAENGIYTSGAGAWTRTTDADAPSELNAAAITVINGTLNASTSWVQTTASPTIGVSPVIWAPFGVTYGSDGTTILQVGNIFSVGQIDLTTNVTGVLPYANGGTNTNTAFTQGSAIFAGAAAFAEDNANFFYDDTNNRLGIRTVTPRSALTIGAFPVIGTYPAADAAGFMLSSSTAGAPVKAVLENTAAASAVGGGNIILAQRDAAFTPSGSRLGSIQFAGSINAGGTVTTVGAKVEGMAAGLWSAISAPTHLDFYTTPAATTTAVRVGRIFTTGGWTVGLNPTSQFGTFNVNPLTLATTGIHIRPSAGVWTGDYLQAATSAGVNLARIASKGEIFGIQFGATGTAGTGFMDLATQSVEPSAPVAGTSRIYSNAFGWFSVEKLGGQSYSFDNDLLLTSDRVYQLQDLSHIIANVPTTAGTVTTNGSTLSSKIDSTLKTTVTQTIATTTPTTITQLTSASLATGTYKFSGIIVAQSTVATTGVGFRVSAVGGALSGAYAKWEVSQNADGTNKDFVYDQLVPGTNVTSPSVQTANTDLVVAVSGTFTVSGAGTVAIQMRSETGVAVSVRAGSYITIEAI